MLIILAYRKKFIRKNRLKTKIKILFYVQGVVIDKIGNTRIDLEMKDIFPLITKCYKKRIIITTYVLFSKCGEFLNSSTLANEVMYRLLHHTDKFLEVTI